MARWTLDDIPWDRFAADKADPEIVKIVKAAAMVEYNSAEYADYLCNVFADDPAFRAAARDWAEEEIQHGLALRRWAEIADPGFDFDAAFKRFTEGYQQVPLDVSESVRGSRTGELIARCVVEVGTSSYYSALRDAAREPVLREICHRIAGDEFRHYKLFLTHLRRYQKREGVALLARLKVALGRLAESEDDELAFAYYCGAGETRPYERARFTREYERRALPLYRYDHVRRGIGMVLKAVGLRPQGGLARAVVGMGWWLMRRRLRRLEAAPA